MASSLRNSAAKSTSPSRAWGTPLAAWRSCTWSAHGSNSAGSSPQLATWPVSTSSRSPGTSSSMAFTAVTLPTIEPGHGSMRTPGVRR